MEAILKAVFDECCGVALFEFKDREISLKKRVQINRTRNLLIRGKERPLNLGVLPIVLPAKFL